jgi:ATP/maltotriose-dependent transcriptional regulator MalT
MDLTLPAPAAAGTDLFRTSLIERVRAARPAIVALVAPAGFGKSAFVRQLLEGSAYAVCDCRGVRSDADLARHVLPALADENPDRSASLSQSEAALGDGHGSAADRVAVALAAWRVRPPGASTFVFENTEDAIADSGARELLAKLLASRTDGRTVVICSRESLRMHLSRFAPPHQILGLRASDLAFTADEMRAIGAPTGASAQSVERVASISAGWPIAVLLLARFAHEGRLDPLLDKLDDVAYEELH